MTSRQYERKAMNNVANQLIHVVYVGKLNLQHWIGVRYFEFYSQMYTLAINLYIPSCT